jgi:hypothetical protein
MKDFVCWCQARKWWRKSSRMEEFLRRFYVNFVPGQLEAQSWKNKWRTLCHSDVMKNQSEVRHSKQSWGGAFWLAGECRKSWMMTVWCLDDHHDSRCHSQRGNTEKVVSLEGVEARSMIESAWASLGDTIQPIHFAFLSPSKPTFTHKSTFSSDQKQWESELSTSISLSCRHQWCNRQ